MSQVSAVLRKTETGYAHWCPGCQGMHYINVGIPRRPNWDFDGNVESPTFNPSVRITYNGHDADQVDDDGTRNPSACCHYFIKNGKIQFLSDCTHALQGQTIPLPKIPA